MKDIKIKLVSDLTKFQQVQKLVNENPNDMELGRLIRKMVYDSDDQLKETTNNKFI